MTQPPPDLFKNEPWHVVVEAQERTYVVYLAKGFLRYGFDKYGWIRFTVKSAQRKGERELAKLLRREARIAERQASLDAQRDAKAAAHGPAR